jgi:hypothetical protein
MGLSRADRDHLRGTGGGVAVVSLRPPLPIPTPPPEGFEQFPNSKVVGLKGLRIWSARII